MKIAIIDLGSNTFHMVLYTVNRKGNFTISDRQLCVNALGRYLTDSKELPFSEIKRNAEVVKNFTQSARCKGAISVYAFGTGIFRELTNAAELTDEIFRQSGLVVDILTPREEAEIVYAAAKNKYRIGAGTLIIDIGGGSSEFIYTGLNTIKWFTSVPSGTASLLQILQEKGHISQREKTKHIKKTYFPLLKQLQTKKIAACYGTSGFLRYIARWLGKARELSSFAELTMRDISSIATSLRSGRFTKGTQRERDLVMIGTDILREIMPIIGIGSIRVSSVSSREGYLFNKINTNTINAIL
jgi:exopolyphosphatase/guanosine-5'-triphosphate,3'-diphosphate pyrophosphatase